MSGHVRSCQVTIVFYPDAPSAPDFHSVGAAKTIASYVTSGHVRSPLFLPGCAIRTRFSQPSATKAVVSEVTSGHVRSPWFLPGCGIHQILTALRYKNNGFLRHIRSCASNGLSVCFRCASYTNSIGSTHELSMCFL